MLNEVFKTEKIKGRVRFAFRIPSDGKTLAHLAWCPLYADCAGFDEGCFEGNISAKGALESIFPDSGF